MVRHAVSAPEEVTALLFTGLNTREVLGIMSKYDQLELFREVTTSFKESETRRLLQADMGTFTCLGHWLSCERTVHRKVRTCLMSPVF